MKKWLLVLGMITCVFGASLQVEAAEASSAGPIITEEQALAGGDQLVESIAMICAQNMQSQYASDSTIAAALDSWTTALEDMGSYVKILDHSAEISDTGAVVNVKVEGTKGNAMVKIVLDDTLAISSITTTPISPIGGIVKDAAVIILLILGVVFIVLVIVGFAKSRSGFIPKIKAAFTDQTVGNRQVDNADAQAVRKEEYSDDLELVAVIAAAVAAAAGASSTDGFVVRSIRKRRTF
ncbi:MAG: hypothetical protein GX235_03980 [Clostridiales bacterium]|nr:hypothetical protein [Clostridiales bacterium]